MGRELWEIVRADQVKVGDVVTIEPDLTPWTMDAVRIAEAHLFYKGDGIPTEFSMPRERNVFRRVDPADDPRVLRRTIDNMMEHQAMTNTLVCPVEDWIEDARRELESEGQNGQ